MQLICSVALCSLLIAVTWAAGGDNQHVADNKEVPLKKLKLALGKDIQRERELREEDFLAGREDDLDEGDLDIAIQDNDGDDEGDADNTHEFLVVGRKGETNAAHDKYRKYQRTNIHIGNEEAVIQDQETECLEYHRQQEMAIRHGRKPEDVPTPRVPCETIGKRGRNKRLARRNPGIWDKGIVPFLFDVETMSDKDRQMGRLRAHNHYEYWTCMRFVPYNETTQSDYGLGHNNYLFHVDKKGCWSYIGNSRNGNRQYINCCGGDICVHELGHAFGFVHEQSNPLRDNYMEVHYGNILKDYQKQYYEENIKKSRLFGYYDLSSAMHYGIYDFSNGGETMSVFDPELEYLVKKSDPYQYYLFGEVSQITDCNGIKCSSFSLACENSGYPAFIKNKCTCRCPEGLDPATGCRTQYDGDRMIATTWPSDSFTLLSTRITGCPSGFYEGGFTQHHHDTRMTHHSDTFSADVISNSTSTRYKFCTKKKTRENGISPSWPEGKYCIYRYEGGCPNGFNEGYIQYDDTKIPSDFYGILPDGQFSRDARFYFCCRGDGKTKTPITLPSEEPFILFADTSSCQKVSGMKASMQYLRIKNNREILHTSGDIPRLKISYKVNYSLDFCYYTPTNFDEKLSYSRWPKEPFALIQAASGCPEGFESGQLVEYSQYSFVSSDTDTALKSGDKALRYKFCTKTETTPIGDRAMWSPGSYCILRVGGVCPDGFSEGSISLVDSQPPDNLTGSLPDGSFVDHVNLNFCCRSDGFTRNPIQLPNKEPFIMFKESPSCQNVEDMSFEEGRYIVGTKSKAPSTSGDTPKIHINYYKITHFYICYYYPAQYDCGDTIHLTKDGQTSADISSPGYPNLYPGGKTCYWNIIAPNGFKLKLEFNEFDILAHSDGTCDDRLEIRHAMPGQFGLSYCGDRYPMTVLSEDNHLGLTFETSLRKHGSGFSAKATLLEPNDTNFCYTNNGGNYRGNVDITRRFARCLPWSDVKHCSSNTYNPMNLDDDLLSNYCRNPGHGTRPWCITNKFLCTRNYCDVCGIEKCYDIFDDCVERTLNMSNCDHDPEMQRGCRMSCNLCNILPQNRVGNVTCDKPNIPSDSTSGTLKENYSVDEIVEFTCKTNAFEEQTITCLADGSWSNAGFACGRCKTGWTPYQGQCYKVFEEEVDRTTAVARCLGENNATLASSKDTEGNNFLTTLVQNGVEFWIGLENGFWPDGEKLQWTNYERGSFKGCALVSARTGKWQGINCGSAFYIAYVCSYSPKARQICEDATPKCEIYLNLDPRACENEDFVWHTCPKTCGYCDNIQDNCPVPCVTPDSNTELVRSAAALSTGNVLEYKCKAGFSHVDGNLHRACLRNGTFSGSLPVCKASSTIAEPNNAAPLLKLRKSLPKKHSYTAMNDMMRIEKSGKIVKWQFYSETNGIASLQVWRPTSTVKTYTLIGQNEISETYEGRIRTYEVSLDNQIKVQSGDMIGVFPLSAEIPYERCNTADVGATYGSVMMSVSRKYTTSGWTVLSDYSFKNSSSICSVIPVTAFIR
ncbi:uncharacterized protein LOC125652111 isoform X1 [Ostrea edulis]|uniref:uncharacterized protein LOC125652111 isoform X1 n=2 Tax=Ostrea edulis TaxID=37623 RepID=UPI0020947B07|nr:uncharacterized protein LOC125652111 isoform X1 [Ostrea edulis]